MDRLSDVQIRPVFIIGPHRSGTTILYKVLAETSCFNVTTAYHILNQSRLLHLDFHQLEQQARAELNQLFESKGLKDREFDSMKITPDIPEEYCFVLNHQDRRPLLSPANLERFVEFCKKVQLTQQPERPLLLKSPFDTTNFLHIYRTFPNAKFIFIYRHPAEVINSQIRAIRSVLERKNEYVALVWERYRRVFENPAKLALARWIYSESFPFLYYQVSRNIARNCDYVFRNLDTLGANAYGLTYRHLCGDPNAAIRQILGFLNLSEDTPRDYTPLIRPRESTFLPEVAKNRLKIGKRNEAYCRRFGV